MAETPQDRWERANIKRLQVKLHTTIDADILNKLDSVPNKQGYIKQLIRQDIAASITENK